MKGLILTNAYSTSKEYLYQSIRLKEEFSLLGVDIDIKQNNNFDAFIKDNIIYTHCKDYDFVIYWDKDKYILSMLDKLHLPIFNNKQAILDCDDKMLTYIRLANENIPLPKTLPGLFCYTKEEKIKQSSIKRIEEELNYPLIAKYSYGSLGEGVFLVHNRNELLDVMERLKCEPHLYQENIASSYGKDIRIIVIGDKVVGGMLRQSNGNFKSNVGAGGKGTPYKIDAHLSQLALKVKADEINNIKYSSNACNIKFRVDIYTVWIA